MVLFQVFSSKAQNYFSDFISVYVCVKKFNFLNLTDISIKRTFTSVLRDNQLTTEWASEAWEVTLTLGASPQTLDTLDTDCSQLDNIFPPL